MNNHSNKASSSSSAATRTSNTTTAHTATAMTNGNSSTINNLAKQVQRYCTVDPMSYFPMGMSKEMPPPEKPTLAMEIFPPFAEFIEFGGASKHTLTNTGGSRMVFKVKCSNNAIFKVAPVYALLDPGASIELQILRQESPSKRDKLVFMFKEAKKGEKDPKKAFAGEGQTGKTVLPMITTPFTGIVDDRQIGTE